MIITEQFLLGHPALEHPRTLLANYVRTNADHGAMLREVAPYLAMVKRTAVANNEQSLAKAVWCLETVAAVQRNYLNVFIHLKESKFYAAWCALEGIEKTLHVLRQHLQVIDNEYGLSFIRASTIRWQSVYPYAVFASPEIWKREVQCGLCNAIITLRNGCGHRINEIYDGERCFHRVTRANVLAIAIVHNPAQRYSVLFLSDSGVSGGKANDKAYPLARYVINGLSSPWDAWTIERTTTRHPHTRYRDIGPDEECPCVAPQGTYAHCCLPQKGVLRPHVIIHFSVPPPPKFLKLLYV